MRISDWSSDVCSSDLLKSDGRRGAWWHRIGFDRSDRPLYDHRDGGCCAGDGGPPCGFSPTGQAGAASRDRQPGEIRAARSEEHTSELQSLMRISYAVFCLKKKLKMIFLMSSMIMILVCLIFMM